MKPTLTYFDHPLSFLQDAKKRGITWDTRKNWCPDTRDELEQMLLGKKELEIKAATELIKKIERFVQFPTFARHWNPSVAGAFPNVPAYLTNEERQMYARKPIQTSQAPLKIYICGTSSAGVPLDWLTQRNICLLALVLLLQRRRPTQAWLYQQLDGMALPVVRIPTQPLNLSAASIALINTSFTRGLGYEWARHVGQSRGRWYAGGHTEKAARELFPAPNTYIFPPVHAEEVDEKIEPLSWVITKLQQLHATA